MMSALAATAMTLGELLGAAAGAHRAIEISDLTLDSRQVTAGAAFLALPGARAHGLDYVGEALARGAAVIIYEPSPRHPAPPAPSVALPELGSRLGELARTFFARCLHAPSLTGVTGTNGKSTVAYLIAQAMGGAGADCAYIGTLGFGRPGALTPHALTTPDCLTLHRELRTLGAPRVAMEVSSHALAQGRVAGLVFERAVFTNLTRDHLDEHGELARYGEAKARLFRRPGLRHAVVNLDDAFAGSLIAGLAPAVEPLGVSLRGASGARLTARVVRCGMDGIELALSGAYGEATMRSPLIGDFNAENLLLAAGALTTWETPLGEACAALASAQAPPGRMEVLGGGTAPWVVIDYAHTPAALERVLDALRGLIKGAVWCVFGCGGERDRGKRPMMGAAAAARAEHLVLTDDNPRSEDPGAIVAEIRAGFIEHPDVLVEHDRARAVRDTIVAARAGDVVLIAGKGHEAWQLIGSERRAFSDRAHAAAALGGRS